MSNLRTEEISKYNHRVLFGDRLLGHFIMDVDGFYYFDYVTAPNGLWTSYSLRMVADLLEEMNKPYENNVKEYFEKNGETSDSVQELS
jgi:hypothetical protein